MKTVRMTLIGMAVSSAGIGLRSWADQRHLRDGPRRKDYGHSDSTAIQESDSQELVYDCRIQAVDLPTKWSIDPANVGTDPSRL